MTVLLKLCGCALIGAICAMTLKSNTKSIGVAVAVISSVIVIGAVIARLSGAIETLNGIMRAGNMTYYGTVMLKALGVGIVVNTVGSICRDMGEGTISSVVELAGKVEIVLICLPIITETLSLIKELLS